MSNNIKLSDRVKEKSYSTGTGPFLLEGELAGFSSFSGVYTSGESVFYAASDGDKYEVGSGVYIETSNQSEISRFAISTSSSNDSIVDFPAGIKEVYVTYPGEYAVFSSSGNQDPDNSGVAFWSSRQSLSYNDGFVFDNSNTNLGIKKSNPEYAIDVGGDLGVSLIRSSGFITADSGILFSGVNALYSGGRQLEPFMRNEVDPTTGTDDLFSLSGIVDQRLLFKKQPPATVFAGPSGDCGCVSDYPVFRPLRFDDIVGVNQIINDSGNLAIPTFDLFTDNNISADQAGVMAFSTGDNYLMIANGTSWVKVQLT
jgi:hypothetical protein